MNNPSTEDLDGFVQPQDLDKTLPGTPADYMRAGFALVRVIVGFKGPRTRGWNLKENAYTNPLRAGVLAHSNIGLAHRWSGTCAVDIDSLEKAWDWFMRRRIDLQELLDAADAVQILSGRPGRAKLLYRLPPGVEWLPTHSLNSFGFELRCATKDGTATVQDLLPPSYHPNTGRPYRWAGAGDWRQLPTLPKQLLDIWLKMGSPRKPRESASQRRNPKPTAPGESIEIPEGGRNTTLTSLAGTMRNRGMDPVAIEAALIAQNEVSCSPPLPIVEVQAIARSIARYTPGAPPVVGDWEHPQPLDRERSTSEPYPLAALPGLIGEAVAEYQAFGQQPLGLVACSALSLVSLVTQGLADVERGKNLRGPISLNFMVIAQSGERKTAADRVFGTPLTDWERARADLMSDDIHRRKLAIASWESKVEGLKAAIRSSMRKRSNDVEQLEARLAELATSRPEELAAPRLRYEDVNPQSLASSLATGHPSAALWSDEGGMVTGSHGMGKDSFLGFLAMLNRLWDGGSVRQDRKQASSVHLEGRRLTVSLMLQPAVLSELLQRGSGLSRGSGFLARYLMAAPTSTMGTRFYREPSPGLPALKRFHDRVRDLLDTALLMDERGRLQPPILTLSPGAFEVWRNYHDRVERELAPFGDYRAVCDFAAKSAENAARLAACLQVFLGNTGKLDLDVMQQGAEVAHWHLRESLRLMNLLDEPQSWSDARALDSWLESRDSCPVRDVLNLGPYQLRDKVRRNAAIKVLEELGRARTEVQSGRETLVRNPNLK